MIERFTLRTTARNQLIDITTQIQTFVKTTQIRSGICVVFTPHTTAAITINENADPSVKADVLKKLNESFPKEDDYRHAEGNSDSHIKSSLVGCSETIIVADGQLVLGTWQGVYFCEFDGPRNREFIIKLVNG